MDGVFALSRTFDSIGVMAKSTEDVALLASALLISESQQSRIRQVVKTPHTVGWKDLAVAFTDCSIWQDPAMVIIFGMAHTEVSDIFTPETRVRIFNCKDWQSRGFCRFSN